ncbi:MAG: Hsp33 family molecular chaperone HslO [Pseudomonadota bacterium]
MGTGFLRGLADEAGVRVLAVDATAVAEEVRRRHALGPAAARVAAEGMVAAQLMSAWIKGEERVTLQVQAERPRFALIADVAADGAMRGRFTPASIPDEDSFRGAVLVIKHDAERELYRGVAPVEDTGFQGALQGYLVRSQQAVGIVRIAAVVTPEGVVASAVGLLVEKLPDQDEGVFHDLFDGLAEADPGALLRGVEAGDLWGFPLRILERREVVFRCHCGREKSADILCSLGPEELRGLLEEQGGAEITCNFCREVYRFDERELGSLIEEISPPRGG